MEVGRGGTGNRRFPPKVVSEPWGHSVRRPRTPHRCAWGQEVTPHPFSSLHYKYLRPERSSQKLPASRGASFLRPGTARRPRAPAPRRPGGSPRSVAPGARAQQLQQVVSGVGTMRRNLRRMLRTGGKKEPQGVVYQGVEDDMDDSKDSFKVPWAIGGRERVLCR